MIETLLFIALITPIVIFVGKEITNKIADHKAKKYVNEVSSEAPSCDEVKETKECQTQQSSKTLNSSSENTSRYSIKEVENKTNSVENVSLNKNEETSQLNSKQEKIVPTPHFKDAEEPITIIEENIL